MSEINGFIVKPVIFCFYLVFFVAAAPVMAQPVTISVPGDYPTIQQALTVAQSGDTIIVGDGTYYENDLDFGGKAIHLISASGPGSTIIDGSLTAPIFRLNNNEPREAIIEGFTITNGYGNLRYLAGGVYINNGSSPTIKNNIITNNTASWAGAGITISNGSNPLILNNEISYNTVPRDGGGIHIYLASAEIDGNTFSYNVASGEPKAEGGAIKATLSTDVTIKNNTIQNNTAGFAGGGIYVFGTNAEIINNQVTDNDGGGFAGGIGAENQIAFGNQTVKINENYIKNNTATKKGGGIHTFMENTSSYVEIMGNIIIGNSAVNSSCTSATDANCGLGGGIGSFDGTEIHKVKNNQIKDNRADLYGGAVFTNMDLIFEGNSIDFNAGVYNHGGFACIGTSNCSILRNSFANNYVENPSASDLIPGALYVKNATAAVIENNFFLNNTGYQAGAVAINSNSINTAIIHNTFANNTTTYSAGGTIFVTSDATFVNNIFYGDLYGIRIANPINVAIDYNRFYNNLSGLVLDPPNIYSLVSDLNNESFAYGNSEGDPSFTDEADYDFHLSSSSILIDQGICDSNSSVDYDGDPRPTGIGCDIGADEFSEDLIGLSKNGDWYLDINGNDDWDGSSTDSKFRYGRSTDAPLLGDWDNDGVATIGIKRGNNFYLRNVNSTGPHDISFNFGKTTDEPLTGDWNGYGDDTIGVRRGNNFYLRNVNSTGPHDISFNYGKATDIQVVGDWDGDGIDTIGVRRGNIFYLRNSNSTGPHDMSFNFGEPTDIPVIGDWDADGVDTIGVYRPSNGMFYLRNSNSTGPAETVGIFVILDGRPFAGKW